MPELPEVEVTRRALRAYAEGRQVAGVVVRQWRLRLPVPAGLPQILQGSRLQRLDRRGKYLLWRFPGGVLVSHLGMSGSWRVHAAAAAPPAGAHDHLDLRFDDWVLRLNDPRRFGSLLWVPDGSGPVEDLPSMARLGIEPFDPQFDGAWLRRGLAGRRGAIKSVLLQGDVVVGAGNIYASESLHAAGIHPETPAARVGPQRCARLAASIRAVLEAAIAAGGSSLRDFAHADGSYGEFIAGAAVYGREGQPCGRCGRAIRRIVQQQRATYFCPSCQRR